MELIKSSFDEVNKLLKDKDLDEVEAEVVLRIHFKDSNARHEVILSKDTEESLLAMIGITGIKALRLCTKTFNKSKKVKPHE